MYYRIPKEYFIPVVTGDIVEEYIGLNRMLLEDDLIEKKALEEADKEFIESQIKGHYSKEDECYSVINEYIE